MNITDKSVLWPESYRFRTEIKRNIMYQVGHVSTFTIGFETQNGLTIGHLHTQLNPSAPKLTTL